MTDKYMQMWGEMRFKYSAMIIALLVLQLIFLSSSSYAATGNESNTNIESKHFQLALFNPIQLVDEHNDIAGVRLNLFWGKNADVSGVDLGLGVNDAVNFKGIQIGTLNSTGLQLIPFHAPERLPVSSATGIQIALLMNTTNSFNGIQLSGANLDYGESGVEGVQAALVLNGAVSRIKGLQLGAINLAGIGGDRRSIFSSAGPNDEGTTGMQIGILNGANFVTGIQIGLINYCKDLKGIQIGLINYIDQSRVPFLPIINAKF